MLHRLQHSSGAAHHAAGRVRVAAAGGEDSELSGWRCCGVCGIRLENSLPMAAWHMQQHLQAQHAADALNAHAQRFTNLARRLPPGLFEMSTLPKPGPRNPPPCCLPAAAGTPPARRTPHCPALTAGPAAAPGVHVQRRHMTAS